MAEFLANISKLPDDPLPHPFYPLEANIVGYLANEWSVPKLLGVFFAGCAVELGITLMIINRFNPTLKWGDKAALLWFVVCKEPVLEEHLERLLTLCFKLAQYICSLRVSYAKLCKKTNNNCNQDISHSTMLQCRQCKIRSARCGRNTRSPTQGT